MRISQVKSLSEEELSLLLYIVNIIHPIKPGPEITPKLLPTIRHDALLWIVSQQEPKLTDAGKLVFQSLMTKLNKTWIQEATEQQEARRPEMFQQEFELWSQSTLPL
jgi:hypothetical protein